MAIRLINMTISGDVAIFYERQLKLLFGNIVDVFFLQYGKNGYSAMADGDLYLITATSTPQELSFIPQGKQVVLTSITFTRKNVDRLKELPWGTEAMLVNSNGEMAIEAIADLNRLGVKNLNFTPYYPGVKEVPDIDLAVAIGVPNLVPKRAKTVICMEHRTFSANTIMEIALRIGRADLLEKEPFIHYFTSLAVEDFTLSDLSNRAFSMENKFASLLGAMKEGIIGVNTDNTVFAFNDAAQEIFQIKKEMVLGKKTEELIPKIPRECFQMNKETESRLVHLHGTDLSVTITPIANNGQYRGCFAAVQRFYDEEQKQHTLRMQLLNKGYTTKYTFDNIIGECPSILQAKDVARKMAQTEASILLQEKVGQERNYLPMPYTIVHLAATCLLSLSIVPPCRKEKKETNTTGQNVMERTSDSWFN